MISPTCCWPHGSCWTACCLWGQAIYLWPTFTVTDPFLPDLLFGWTLTSITAAVLCGRSSCCIVFSTVFSRQFLPSMMNSCRLMGFFRWVGSLISIHSVDCMVAVLFVTTVSCPLRIGRLPAAVWPSGRLTKGTKPGDDYPDIFWDKWRAVWR